MERIPDPRELEQLDSAMDGLLQGEDVPEQMRPLLEVAARARAAFAVPVPDELAARHLAALEAGDTPSKMAGRSRRARAAFVALAAALTVSMLASAAVASSGSALPGESLYPVKRAVESMRLSLERAPAGKARLHLEFAHRRLGELQTLLAASRAGESVDVGAAMSAYGDQLANVQDDLIRSQGLGQDFDALLEHLALQLEKHVLVLTDLRDNRVPEQARDAIQRAIDNAEKAKAKVAHGRDNGPAEPGGAPGNSGNAPGRNQSIRHR